MNTSRTKSSSRHEESCWGGGDGTGVTDRPRRQVRWFYRLLVFYLVWLGFLLYVALH